MTIATSAEQIAVCDAIASWAARAATATKVRGDIDKPSDSWQELWAELAGLGLFGAAVSEASGGFDARFADVAAMAEECGRRIVPGPIAPTVAAAIGLGLSDDERASALAERIIAGEVPVVAPANQYRLGRTAIELDHDVDLGLVPGYVDNAALLITLVRPSGAVWAVLPPAFGTRDVRPAEPLDGTMSLSCVSLSGLNDADVIDVPDVAGAALAAAFTAYQSGVAKWTLDTAVEYAKVRTQFGSPIGSFQAVKHICAEMLCRSEQLATAAWDQASAVEDLLAGDLEAARQWDLANLAAAVLVADLPLANARDCIQVLGGIGFTFEHDAHLYLRSALAARSILDDAGDERIALGRTACDGERRRFQIDLSAVEARRGQVRATVADIAGVDDPGAQRKALATSGYLTPHWPIPYGLGADPAMQLLIDAELERAGVVRPDLVIAGWAIPTILEHGTTAQRERFVADTLTGDIAWCQLFSEPEAGSDLASLRTRAIRAQGPGGEPGWKLTGQKIWTSAAHTADWAVCLARTDPDSPKHKGITYFLVDMSSAGLDIRPLRELTGRALFNEVFLDDVFVPDDCVVGEVNGGWRLARTTLANERVAMGGSGLGKEMDGLLRQIADADRVLSDGQLAELGTLVADAHNGRALDARAVTQRLTGSDPGAVSSVRKLIGVTHRQAVPDFALRLLGVEGIAMSDASDAFLLNRCLSIAGGTTQILKTAAAERILGLPRG
ncbi:putative acyl-CoA dehydrogenase [Gordonia effusa NBRC 100432]|uniref:Putative acyl-CoA dehydrogenase n=1 Tax=Gordonia effusa NBRC 100432 TaxID=1077974 RepID=H0R0F9_9ACTN|nr:acyl-CoA dehydrogenase [Gordonia effusa]GAB18560.1 putative acyl-CoA dehydrogenase [Gordonia effusa NBRC 100432]